LDHATQGIRVNCICPGRVETPFVSARLREYPDPEAAYREMASTQAIGRMGRPEEIAAAVVYLASDEAALITGTALATDGGWSAGKESVRPRLQPRRPGTGAVGLTEPWVELSRKPGRSGQGSESLPLPGRTHLAVSYLTVSRSPMLMRLVRSWLRRLMASTVVSNRRAMP